jgi:hypothetical protein
MDEWTEGGMNAQVNEWIDGQMDEFQCKLNWQSMEL